MNDEVIMSNFHEVKVSHLVDEMLSLIDAGSAAVAASGPSEVVELPNMLFVADPEDVHDDEKDENVWDNTELLRNYKRGPFSLNLVQSL